MKIWRGRVRSPAPPQPESTSHTPARYARESLLLYCIHHFTRLNAPTSPRFLSHHCMAAHPAIARYHGVQVSEEGTTCCETNLLTR